MLARISAEALLSKPVRVHGIELGRAVEVVFDAELRRAVGFEVRCGDGVHRFLPFGAARIRGDEIGVDSALQLLNETELDFYRSKARTLSSRRGCIVARGRTALGKLTDVVLEPDGSVSELLVDGPGANQRVPLDDVVRVLDDRQAA